MQGRARPRGRAILALAWLSACASPQPLRYEDRIAELERESQPPAVEARLAELDAARELERADPALDEFELRLENRDDGDNTFRVLTRVPLPNLRELRAQRAARRAETDAALARLDEAQLTERVETCFRSLEGLIHQERVRLYDGFAERQQRLIEWNEDWRKSGAVNERTAMRFELQSRVRLATRLPAPPSPSPIEMAALPPVRAADDVLDQRPELILDTVRRRHPRVAVAGALSQRYQALSQRAEIRGRPSLNFVDFGYESKQRRDNELSAQIALNVPFGRAAAAEASGYRALQRAQRRDLDGVVAEQARLGLLALRDIDHFERNSARWQELLELADAADRVADRWWRERAASPAQIAGLLEQAYDARSSVAEARSRAGRAGCSLLELTGVSADEWPRTRP